MAALLPAVHLNSSLSNVQKFNYLKAQLEHEALQSIAGFALTNLNYDEAINVLKERFGITDTIVSTYLEAFIEIPQPRNELRSLKTVYDQIESYVRGLDALGESQATPCTDNREEITGRNEETLETSTRNKYVVTTGPKEYTRRNQHHRRRKRRRDTF